MALKRTISYTASFTFFSAWLIALLTLMLRSKISSPFPSTIDGLTLTIFWVAAVLSAVSFFLIGLDELGAFGYIRRKLFTTPIQ
jgi:hypothetical protein